MDQRFLVVLNPAAGRHGLALAEAVYAALRAQGADPAVYRTTGPGDATRWLRTQATLPPVVVAAGGDGTVNEVINGLSGRDVTLALIPGGTTNVLATELGYPSAAAAIAGVLLRGREQHIHLAAVNGRRFSMMTGIGYDAWVVAGVDPSVKKRFGKLAYVLSMLRELRRYGERRYRVVIDGEPHEAKSIVITNGRHYAGSYTLSHRADITQPSLQVLLVQAPDALRFFGMLLALPFGRVESLSFIRSVAGRHIEVSLIDDTVTDPVQADGDVVSAMPADIRVEPAPTRVIVP